MAALRRFRLDFRALASRSFFIWLDLGVLSRAAVVDEGSGWRILSLSMVRQLAIMPEYCHYCKYLLVFSCLLQEKRNQERKAPGF
jgi:hypothetical protein